MRLPMMLSFLLVNLPLGAQADPVFVQPIACEIGTSCYIQHYVDRDPTAAVLDNGCGSLSYDGHKGTDFALISLQQMRDGVNVLAAAPGVVRGVRDEMPDTGYTDATRAAIAGRECGNGLAIDHGGGWVTQYCHMKRGSLAVEPGRRVGANTVLGQVGLSGQTQFPHLHLSVRKDGQIVDPFAIDTTCASPLTSYDLWRDALPYTPGGVIDVGFAVQIPNYDSVKDGSAHAVKLTPEVPALVTWAYVYGSQAGDVLTLRISGPQGRVIEKHITLEKAQAQLFRAIGRKRPTANWPKGSYLAEAILTRDKQVLSQRSSTMGLR